MEDRKPSEERRSSESRIQRTLLRFAIHAQDAKDLADEVNRRIQERLRQLLREDIPADPPESSDRPTSKDVCNNCADTFQSEDSPPFLI
jgi:hypothetical protein